MSLHQMSALQKAFNLWKTLRSGELVQSIINTIYQNLDLILVKYIMNNNNNK